MLRLLWILGLLLTAGCPQRQPVTEADGAGAEAVGPAESADSIQGGPGDVMPAAVEYPPAAVEYIAASLRQPAADGYPPLERSWLALARLRRLAGSESAAPIRDAVLAMVDAAGSEVLPQLAAAWLAVDPQPAEEFITQQLADGHKPYVNSLVYSPESALRVLTAADLAQFDAQLQLKVTRLLVQWHPLDPEFTPVLEQLATSDSEDVGLQADGLLLALDGDREAERQELWGAIRDQDSSLSAAAEGIKLSRDPQLADALVPLVASTRLGDEDPEADKQKEEVLGAYALAYLPGEQAQLMRRKLLGAVNPTVRWAARLGELLHGDGSFWTTAVDRAGVDDAQLWLALQPADVVHPDLLPTLLKAAQNGAPETRLRAAQQLNRYTAYTSDPVVGEALATLIIDEIPEVSAAAWMSAGWLARGQFAEQAGEIIEATDQPAAVRIAAAYYVMRSAEARGLEVTQ